MKLITDLGMLYPTINSKQKKRFAIYQCDCGNEFKAQIQGIKSGNTKSCGCFNIRNTKHGLGNHRLYDIWSNILQRCYNIKSKSYQYYGERGIKICDEWLDINNFINDMFPSYIEGLTLDRENNDLDYCKNNCRWTTKAVQTRNTRKIRINNTSGYRGVIWYKKRNKWRTKIMVSSKDIHIGYFNTALDGAKAYDKYVIENNLEHTLNFSYN